jgi:hypothetical protein
MDIRQEHLGMTKRFAITSDVLNIGAWHEYQE